MCLRLKGDCFYVCSFHHNRFSILYNSFWFDLHRAVFKAPSCTISLKWNVSSSLPHWIQNSPSQC